MQAYSVNTALAVGRVQNILRNLPNLLKRASEASKKLRTPVACASIASVYKWLNQGVLVQGMYRALHLVWPWNAASYIVIIQSS